MQGGCGKAGRREALGDFVLGEVELPPGGAAADGGRAPHEERRRRRRSQAPLAADRPLLLRATDPFLAWGPVLLVAFATLAWGSVQAWSLMVVTVTACALGGVWILRLALFPGECAAWRSAHSHLRSWSGGLHRPLLALLAVGALQLAPLGPVVETVSPAAALLQQQAGAPPASRTISLARAGTRLALAQLAALALLFFAVLDGAHGRTGVRRLALALVVLGFAHAIGGILWHYQGAGRAYWGAMDRASSFGPYVNRNHFAGLMGMTVPFGVGCLLSHGYRRGAAGAGSGGTGRAGRPRARRPELGAQRFLVGFAVAVMAGALGLSLSRGGIVSTLAALAALAIAVATRRETRGHLWKAVAAIAAALAFTVWLAAGPLFKRLGTLFGILSDEAVAGPRTGIWADALRLAADFPLLGTGFGTFAEVYPGYQTAHAQGFVREAHSDWVQLLAEGGLAGTLAALAVVAVFASVTLRLLARRRDPEAVFLASGGLAGLLAFLLHGFVEFNAHIPANALWFTLLAAVTLKAAASTAAEGT